MSLPRNARIKNAMAHKKRDASRDSLRNLRDLDAICKKHNIDTFNYRDCKFSTIDGQVSLVDHSHARGNLAAGISLLQSDILIKSEKIYDIIEIQKNKEQRDLEKQKKDEENSKLLMEEQKENSELMTHQELMDKLQSKNDANGQTTNGQTANDQSANGQTSNDQTDSDKNSDIASLVKTVDSDDDTDNTVHDKYMDDDLETSSEAEEETVDKKEAEAPPKRNRKKEDLIKKRKEAIRKYNEEIEKKSKSTENKLCRRFLTDLRAKFTLRETDFAYFEVKSNVTPMIINDGKIYELIIPNKDNHRYFLVIGFLQLKSDVIRRIDPSVQSKSALRDQSEFLERIKAKENLVTQEHSEDMIDVEMDDELPELEKYNEQLDADIPDLVAV